jgi:hypothetical protein
MAHGLQLELAVDLAMPASAKKAEVQLLSFEQPLSIGVRHPADLLHLARQPLPKLQRECASILCAEQMVLGLRRRFDTHVEESSKLTRRRGAAALDDRRRNGVGRPCELRPQRGEMISPHSSRRVVDRDCRRMRAAPNLESMVIAHRIASRIRSQQASPPECGNDQFIRDPEHSIRGDEPSCTQFRLTAPG